ncbi:MAG TPA: polymer-forming cytoskeletal protein [Terriglobales bacterium]|nr:polymer-forming cytoskeletal protein [Terriglobales bacterium]
MLQPLDNSQKSQSPSNQTYTPVRTATSPTEQASIGRSLVIKGEVSGSESLYIDGRIEGTINIADNRVTIGRNGNVAANIHAREVVIIGKVTGNVQCTDRLEIRSEGALTGDIITQRISVEEGAMLKGSVQIRAAEYKPESKTEKQQAQAKPLTAEASKPATSEQPKPAAAVAHA